MNAGRSTLATIAWTLAVLAAVAVISGPMAIHAGVVTPFRGFRIFGLGLVAGVPILLLALAALLRTRGPERREGRRTAVRATLVSAALVALFAALAAPGAGVPMIHDITTDPKDPPAFVEAVRAPENQDGTAYPPENEPLQVAAYADLAPIALAATPGDAYGAAQRAATAVGWQVVRSDPAGGILEATATSKLFLFVDDVVVRVRPDGDGSRIDVRSRSRVGKGDLGANAARIRAFRDALGKDAQ